MKRQNNFDIIRLLLACVVILFHIGDLSGNPTLTPLSFYFSGHLAVEGFFAISGFLIFASYERSSSLMDYAIKRAGRILPGYWVATALCLAIAFAGGHFHVLKFLLANLTLANFIAPSIPGVFANNPVTDVMNGALWTIKVEVMFYITVPFIVWLGRRTQRDAVLVAVFLLSIAYHFAFAKSHTADAQLPAQLCFFMVGALIHYHEEFFRQYGKWLMVAAAALYVLHAYTHWWLPRPLAVASLTLGAALLLPVFRGPTRWGDFSYGTYVLHWPLIQLVVAAGLFAFHPWLGVAATFLLVAIAAVTSWFLVEKPALDRAHHHARRFKTTAQAVTLSS